MSISATTGLVSGTDYTTLINSLITAESAAIDPTENKKTAAETELTAVKAINLKFSYATIDAEALAKEETFRTRSATVADEDMFTATASTDASVGSYSVRVDALAQAEQQIGGAVDSDSTYSGTLTITVGDGETFSYEADGASLTILATAINRDSTAGVSAQVIDVGDGTSRLMLTSDDSGAANTIVLGGDLGSSGPFASMTTITEAQDASVTMRIGTGSTIEITRTSSTNSITDLVTGVDLALKETSEDYSTLTVAADSSAISNYISLFIEDLNTALTAYTEESGYDASSETSGTLFSNSQIRTQIQALHTAMATVHGDGSSLEDLGITYDPTTNQYDLDSDTLETLLAGDPDAAGKLFIDDGIGAKIEAAMSGLTDDTDGVLSLQEDGLDESIDLYSEQIEDFNESLETKRERYKAQFLALEKTLAKLDSQKDALTSFIDGLNSSD